MMVRFASPLGGRVLEAEVPEDRPARDVLRDLIEEGFLPPIVGGRDYSLVVGSTKTAMLPGQTLTAARARTGDVIEIVQANEGAS